LIVSLKYLKTQNKQQLQGDRRRLLMQLPSNPVKATKPKGELIPIPTGNSSISAHMTRYRLVQALAAADSPQRDPHSGHSLEH
jgi:hypothetical protein